MLPDFSGVTNAVIEAQKAESAFEAASTANDTAQTALTDATTAATTAAASLDTSKTDMVNKLDSLKQAISDFEANFAAATDTASHQTGS